MDNFSSVDSGSHNVNNAVSGGVTGSTDAYKAGDIVKGSDGTFFRALQDRTDGSATNWASYSSQLVIHHRLHLKVGQISSPVNPSKAGVIMS